MIEKTIGGYSMKRGVLIITWCIISLFPYSALRAQTGRVLLVGINEYEPVDTFKPTPCRRKPLRNLKGCLNDVEAMKGILQSRFRFEEKNIHTLVNGEATRERIIADFKKYLIREASPGDTCVFYFSGHGSLVKNSKSNEKNGMDETLVPADWARGSRDIRDKELKKLFNQVLDKEAYLTVI
ncbi:MAG: caspase family protein, partial [bacterium]|nr:caspase family protein [bacterium]